MYSIEFTKCSCFEISYSIWLSLTKENTMLIKMKMSFHLQSLFKVNLRNYNFPTYSLHFRRIKITVCYCHLIKFILSPKAYQLFEKLCKYDRKIPDNPYIHMNSSITSEYTFDHTASSDIHFLLKFLLVYSNNRNSGSDSGVIS